MSNNDGGKLVPYSKKGKTGGSGTRLCKPLETDDMTAILDVAITVSKARGCKPAIYPATAAGLEAFKEQTINFFEYVDGVNRNPEIERKLIPDIESWALYLGISRQTLWEYQKRNGEWKTTIEYFKNAIAAIKKQLALCGKIPPMVFVFDSANNHGYVNTSEFKISTNEKTEETKQGNIDEQIRAAGLVWNEAKKQFEQMEG